MKMVKKLNQLSINKSIKNENKSIFGIPFVLVYPNKDIKDEYIQRYKDRGNNDAFVELLTKNWDNWMEEMDNQEGCYKVKLDSGQYLTDVID